VLRRIFVPKGEEVTGEGCILRSYIISKTHQVLLQCSNQEKCESGQILRMGAHSINILVQKSAGNIPLRRPACRWDAVASWLRHYATSRKVAGSIPDEVIGFFS
jgi:hypothetical protein